MLPAVLDTGRYSSAGGLTVRYDELAAAGLEEAALLVMLDPPEHTEFRELFSRGYTPRRVAGIEPAVRGFVRARLDAIAERGECDIVAELFQPVPGFVVPGYLRAPEADRARFGGWTQGIVQASAGASASTAATAAELLTTNPAQRQLLPDRPGLLPAAIEELLRLTSPVQGLARTLTRDTTVQGRVIRRGRKVLLLYGSANRDPRVFGPDADELDILRGEQTRTRHLAFAVGAHHCLGAAAARLQAQVVLSELLARFPRFAVDPAAGTFASGHYTRRYATLPFTTGG